MSDETPAKGPTVDLLGDPWMPPRDPRGRKRHRRLPQIAEKVAVLRAAGRTEAFIASRVGLSEPTLRKYYFRELESGADLIEALLDEAIFQKAMNGAIGAQRLVRDLLSKGKAQVPVARHAQTRPAEPLGKKAQAELDAHSAQDGTKWANLLQ